MSEWKPTGRPSSYTDEVAADICAMIAEGRSLKSICSDEGMPHMSTVFRWLGVHETFRDNYARARDAQADVFADEMTDIADFADMDAAAVAKARLQIDTRKWVASKLKPKKYGDKLGLTDGDGGSIRVNIVKFSGDD